MWWRESRGVAVILLGVLLTGCSNWVARRGGLDPPPAPADHVQLCVEGQCREYHGVHVIGDSVYATPYFQSTKCDSCVRHFPIAHVQRIEERRANTNAYIVFLIVVTPIVVLLKGMSSIGGPGS